MNLPSINSVDFSQKKVIIRADLDVPIKNGQIQEEWRLLLLLPTLATILDKQAAKVLLIGHLGRPDGQVKEEFSLAPLLDFFKSKISTDIEFVGYQPLNEFSAIKDKIFASSARICLLENLRFWPEEEKNDANFAQQIAAGFDIFVNDAFATSHRAHSSIVGLPQFLTSYVGIQFEKEVTNLNKVFENPAKPVVALINGVKKDKLDYVESFKKFCDKILIAGRLPEYLAEDLVDPKLMVAKLNPDKEDITLHSIESFEKEIKKAGTIILSGPAGMYEDEGHSLGTKRVFTAVANSNGFKVAGGGDTIAAINTYGLTKSFDWISAGGGAMLEYLSKRNLPGLEAIKIK